MPQENWGRPGLEATGFAWVGREKGARVRYEGVIRKWRSDPDGHGEPGVHPSRAPSEFARCKNPPLLSGLMVRNRKPSAEKKGPKYGSCGLLGILGNTHEDS